MNRWASNPWRNTIVSDAQTTALILILIFHRPASGMIRTTKQQCRTDCNHTGIMRTVNIRTFEIFTISQQAGDSSESLPSPGCPPSDWWRLNRTLYAGRLFYLWLFVRSARSTVPVAWRETQPMNLWFHRCKVKQKSRKLFFFKKTE